MSVAYQMGSALPPAVKVSMRASKGTPSFTAVSDPAALWLTVSPDSGLLPGTLSVWVNPESLAVGSYTANITVTVSGVAAPLILPVNLAVTSAPPALSISSKSLNFAVPVVPPGSTTQTVLLSVSGNAPVSFTASAGSTPWLRVSPPSGMVFSFAPAQLAISVDASSLNPQAKPYTAKVTVVASGVTSASRSQNITVSLTVNPSAPTIASIFPSTLPVNTGPWTVTVRGTNIYKTTVAKIQSTALATTIISPTALTAVVPASLLTSAGTLNLLLSNPAPGGDSATSAITVANVPTIAAVASTASYATASFSPGELVTIFGSDIGPAAPANMSITNGFVDTSLGGVSVTVDGKAAPIIYASSGQINIQIPYEVSQGAGKALALTNGASAPVTTNIAIAASAPGLFIFTPDPANPGGGQAAVLNYSTATQQYSLNTSSNPAKIGDTILLFLTGEGDYLPAPVAPQTSNTGWIVTAPTAPATLPEINPLPDVNIGGTAASVKYAGPVVGSVTGLMQINVVVPAGSKTGAAVPISVTIGGNTSQAATTIAVHP